MNPDEAKTDQVPLVLDVAASPLSSAPAQKPTFVRYLLLAMAATNAFVLYLDRICMGAVVQSSSFQSELGLGKERVGDVLAAFFLAYALGQLPAGWLADRFGPRKMLVFYILFWSFCTALTGLVSGLVALLVLRFACGLSEAGAYPASGRLMTRWFPFSQRARANSFVAFGGRVGNAIALWLTALLIASFGSWRPVLWVYGSIGLLLAALTWLIFRNEPESHPWVNQAERELIGGGMQLDRRASHRFPWRGLFTHRGLWMLSVTSIGMNLGWAFLITWLPAYLIEVRGLDRIMAGRYVSIALACGMAGMLFGGWWCDSLTRWFGSRWGRRLPFIIGGLVGMVAYLLCPLLASPLSIAIVAGVVAFATDSMTPATWTLGQDIGRQHVGATFAWTNMWGNFGASAVSKLIPWILATSFHRSDWREVFWLCAGGFGVAAGASFFVDATRGLSEAKALPDELPGPSRAA